MILSTFGASKGNSGTLSLARKYRASPFSLNRGDHRRQTSERQALILPASNLILSSPVSSTLKLRKSWIYRWRRWPLERMSRSTSRWRSFSPPSFSLCNTSTYPFNIASGVFRSCAADASALVVRKYRSRSWEYSWSSGAFGGAASAVEGGLAFAGAGASLDIEDTSGMLDSVM